VERGEFPPVRSALCDAIFEQDMNHFASPVLKVVFDGPEVQEQSLYELCRVRSVRPFLPKFTQVRISLMDAYET